MFVNRLTVFAALLAASPALYAFDLLDAWPAGPPHGAGDQRDAGEEFVYQLDHQRLLEVYGGLDALAVDQQDEL